MSDGGAPSTYAGLRAERHGEPDGRPPLVLLHGLSYDRHRWGPLLRELKAVDPAREVLAVDLPGHGQSPPLGHHGLDDVAAAVHRAVTEAGLNPPVVVGHSIGGAIATAYAAAHPVRGVVNIDQPLRVGGFADMLQRNGDVLRGPGYGTIWDGLLGRMGIDGLPPEARALARPDAVPARELLLTYWGELLTTPPAALDERNACRLERIASQGTPYHYVTGAEPDAEYRAWLSRVLPDVAITVLPGSGHFPHLAHPAEVASLLK
ncbi:alpha/beta fold hydrolase [Actinacidiphila glaucinigra]|uniref:alpha/beta fold hydrolase n=1 Tax=Actinacidiphila glaucinigra TaxID=235986 RepID=UPI0035E25B27